MKYFIIMIITTLFLEANEIGRMEAIIQDIEDLRKDYNKCMKELDIKNIVNVIPENNTDNYRIKQLKEENKQMREYKRLLNRERMKNTMLIANMDTLKKNPSSEILNDTNSNASNNKYEKLLISKEKEVKVLKTLKNDYSNQLETKEKVIISLKNKINALEKNTIQLAEKEILCADNNPFPTLIMKAPEEKELEREKNNTIVNKTSQIEEEIDPSTFKLIKQSYIYASVNGNILDTWKIKTTFTSNIKTQNWVKITGSFDEGKWIQATKEMWIKKENVMKR